jgi:aryl-alcohol dehydrogenase-like predicted oxidoreductase
MDEALVCLEQEGLASLQIIFNLFRQKPIEALFAKAAAKKVSLIIRLPLASGLLSGRITKSTTFSQGDHRNYNRDGKAFNVGETFAGLGFERGVEMAEKLKEFVPTGMDMAVFAQRWILDYPEVTVIIPGATRVEQVASNASAGDLSPLSQDLHERLGSFYEREVKGYIRGPY